jgi:hypothetical protein
MLMFSNWHPKYSLVYPSPHSVVGLGAGWAGPDAGGTEDRFWQHRVGYFLRLFWTAEQTC